MSFFLSHGANNIIELLHPHNIPKGEASFPKNWNPDSYHIGGSEIVGTWLKGLMEELDLKSDSICIEPNMAILAHVKWEQRILTQVSVQAIISLKGNIDLFCEQPNLPHQYFRLDYHPDTPGRLFSEISPHIHTRAKGAPRLISGAFIGQNPILDFVEFLYRSYFYDLWLEWAIKVWTKDKTISNNTVNQIETITRAFDSGNAVSLMPKYQHMVRDLKKSLRREKQKSFPLSLNENISRYLAYA